MATKQTSSAKKTVKTTKSSSPSTARRTAANSNKKPPSTAIKTSSSSTERNQKPAARRTTAKTSTANSNKKAITSATRNQKTIVIRRNVSSSSTERKPQGNSSPSTARKIASNGNRGTSSTARRPQGNSSASSAAHAKKVAKTAKGISFKLLFTTAASGILAGGVTDVALGQLNGEKRSSFLGNTITIAQNGIENTIDKIKTKSFLHGFFVEDDESEKKPAEVKSAKDKKAEFKTKLAAEMNKVEPKKTEPAKVETKKSEPKVAAPQIETKKEIPKKVETKKAAKTTVGKDFTKAQRAVKLSDDEIAQLKKCSTAKIGNYVGKMKSAERDAAIKYYIDNMMDTTSQYEIFIENAYTSKHDTANSAFMIEKKEFNEKYGEDKELWIKFLKSMVTEIINKQAAGENDAAELALRKVKPEFDEQFADKKIGESKRTSPLITNGEICQLKRIPYTVIAKYTSMFDEETRTAMIDLYMSTKLSTALRSIIINQYTKTEGGSPVDAKNKVLAAKGNMTDREFTENYLRPLATKIVLENAAAIAAGNKEGSEEKVAAIAKKISLTLGV